MNLLKQRKIIGILLSVIVLVSLLAVPMTVQAAGDNLTLTANPTTISSGSVVTFTLNLDVASHIGGWQTYITFDPSKFQYVANSMTEGSAMSDYAAAHNGSTQSTQTPGSGTAQGNINISYAMVGLDAGTVGMTGQFVGATFQLRALGNVNTTGTLTLDSTKTKVFDDSQGLSIAGLIYTPSLDVSITVPQPQISSFTPNVGGAGTVVTITGSNLNNNLTAVGFNGVAATTFSATSSTTVTATVPAGASTGLVSLTTNGGTATSTQNFTFVPAPHIDSISPTSASYGGSVTISGSNLGSASAVTFGGTSALSITSNTASQIIGVVGSGTSGNVTVTTPGGTATLAGFTYIPPGATINATAPSSVNAGAAFAVTLTIDAGNNQVRGWQSNVSFDATKLQAVGVTEGSFLANWANGHNASTTSVGSISINNVAGTISNINYAVVGGDVGGPNNGGPSGTGVLATINFVAKAGVSGNAVVAPASSLVFDVNGGSFANIQANAGTVAIAYTAPTAAPVTIPVDASVGQQLVLIAPAPIYGWNLVVTPNNNVQRTLNVFANTNWQVTVKATNTSGYLTKYNGGTYYSTVKLANPLNIQSDAGHGAGYAVNLTGSEAVIAAGNAAGQNAGNGGDLRNVMFTQPVTYTDPILPSGYSYHTEVTFTASNTGF